MNLSKPTTPIPCPKGSKAFQPTGQGKLWISWTTPGAEWRRVLEIVKRLPNRRWNPDLKLWEAPDTSEIRGHLLHHGFQLLGAPTGPTAIGMPGLPSKRELSPWAPPWKDVEIPGDWSHLRPYQVESLRMLQYRKGRGALFQEMGLGKTATSLSWVRMNPEFDRIVVIATASTKNQWVREAKKWGVTLPFWVLSGRSPHALPKKGAVVLNWDILESWTDALISWDPQTVIADEVQAVGNPKAKRSKAFLRLTDSRGIVALSGTPARTCPAQLYTVLHALDPKTFSDHWRYLNRYCDPKNNGFSTTYKGSTNAEELHEKIRPLGVRYTKADVLKDLPDRVYTPVLMDCTMSDEYQEAQDRILGMQGHSPGQIRERLGALTASAFEMKKDAVINWIADFLETGEKLVVFGWHIAVLDYLEMHLGNQWLVPKPNGIRYGDRYAFTDSRLPIEYETTVADSFWIPAHGFVLVRTREVIGISDTLFGKVEGRSSVGRLGLIVETAGLCDPGFEGSVTLELVNVLPNPLLVHAGMRGCQITFARVEGSTEGGYQSKKYQGQVATTGSLLHRDFQA